MESRESINKCLEPIDKDGVLDKKRRVLFSSLSVIGLNGKH